MIEPPQLIDAELIREARVARLVFKRDDVRNALTGTHLVEDIITTINWVNDNREISVLIFTGDGKAFSSGGNIKHMRERKGMFAGNREQIEQQYMAGIQRLPLAMEQCQVPVIAAVNGAAVGAGMDLACMCDLRIGSTQTMMGETFINLGIIPGDGGAYFLQRLIGYQRAAELTFSGRLVDADEARSLGLLLEVTQPDELIPRACAIAHTFASKPPQALRLTRQLMRQATVTPLPEFLKSCAQAQALCHHTEDHLEALDAFLEKRDGNFKGQ